MMRSLLFIATLAFLSYGLWVHYWTTIGASIALLAIYPLIAEDVEMREERQRRELLEKLWADEDLSESA